MFVQALVVENFKCFGPGRTKIGLGSNLTAFVGINGAGKTAACEALLRLFGISGQDRNVRAEDFHVPIGEAEAPAVRELLIEAVLAFPELDDAEDQPGDGPTAGGEGDDREQQIVGRRAVPEFFARMAADDDGDLKVRIVLKATWEDDGTVEGAITVSRVVVSTMAEDYGDDDCAPLTAAERSRIQMIYIPASRDGARQVAAFLRGRLWRAAQWSDGLRGLVTEHADKVAGQFDSEPVVNAVESALGVRWQELHSAGTHAAPKLRLIDRDFDQLVRNTELVFAPDPTGRPRPARLLSDGQRSLLHLALTAAALDVEAAVYDRSQAADFTLDATHLPNLTLIAVEEPENSLAPFFLSRIVKQLRELAAGDATQALLSSHSASTLTRIEPEDLRYFRLDAASATAVVRSVTLPDDASEAGKYIREAVRAHPELYFAKAVVLGEGDTEELILPRVAQAQGVDLDPSFVAVVPLGGRHTNHMWRLLNDLGIPHATLLDLDYGRDGAGPARLRDACKRLITMGIDPLAGLDGYDQVDDIGDDLDLKALTPLVTHLQQFGVFFAGPLDLDYAMLYRFPDAYKKLEGGERGPNSTDAFKTVIGEDGADEEYWKEADRAERLRWYRYLFTNQSKPGSHLRALGQLADEELAANAPKVLTALIERIRREVGL